MAQRSDGATVALWAQLILVMCWGVFFSFGASFGNGSSRLDWIFYLPLVCIVPAVTAFRAIRIARVGMLVGALGMYMAMYVVMGIHWSSLLFAFGPSWPAFVATMLLYFVGDTTKQRAARTT